jgi:lysine decarboxylase
MLQGQGKHISFHTPGHKQRGLDITELSYSDNLSAPKGCILQAEKDISAILRSKGSFILTDGSTSGILSMLYAAKEAGVTKIVLSENSHKSLFNGCALLGITPLLLPVKTKENIPLPITVYELNESLHQADALFLTHPDYYGNLLDLEKIKRLCQQEGKLLLIDGAHGSHLHFDEKIYAGSYADMWVDGVHKNLPCFTQGAVVSTSKEELLPLLKKGVDIFRTTSPSYPIMASVEYAVKYPKNSALEQYALRLETHERRYFGGDWTKLCVRFGKHAFEAERELQYKGIYPEFCDGNILLFYLSPATKIRHLKKLEKRLLSLFKKFPYEPIEEQKREFSTQNTHYSKTWLPLLESEGKICALSCGLFPPCFPLLLQGEKITKEKIELLQKADNLYGISEGKICVYTEE